MAAPSSSFSFHFSPHCLSIETVSSQSYEQGKKKKKKGKKKKKEKKKNIDFIFDLERLIA